MSFELDGKSWEPRPGTTVTAEEFATARALSMRCTSKPCGVRGCSWNALTSTTQRGRPAGIGKAPNRAPPHKTLEELEAGLEQRLAAAGARFKAEESQAEKDRAERSKHYDPGRAQARLALPEEQGILADQIRQRDELRALDLSQLPAKDPCRGRLAKVERAITAKSKEVNDLLAVIGEPETVCGAEGWLPAERRERALIGFKSDRGSMVRALRAGVADARARLEVLQYRDERAELREQLRRDQAHLAYWEQMAPLHAADMCSECGQPAWHTPGTTYSIEGLYEITGPCPAWPRWAQGRQAVRAAVRPCGTPASTS